MCFLNPPQNAAVQVGEAIRELALQHGVVCGVSLAFGTMRKALEHLVPESVALRLVARRPGLGLVPTRLPLQLDTPAPCTSPTSTAPSCILAAGRRVCRAARSLASQTASSAGLLLKTWAFGTFSEM